MKRAANQESRDRTERIYELAVATYRGNFPVAKRYGHIAWQLIIEKLVLRGFRYDYVERIMSGGLPLFIITHNAYGGMTALVFMEYVDRFFPKGTDPNGPLV
jgi:hypothetical protein